MSFDKDDQLELDGEYGDTPRRLEYVERQQLREIRRRDALRNEGMPGTWAHCGSKTLHGPHRRTVTLNEGPTHNVLCKGYPGDQAGDAPLGRIVYEDTAPARHGISGSMDSGRDVLGHPHYEPPLRCVCGETFTEPTNDQSKWMAADHGRMAGLLLDAIIHLSSHDVLRHS